MPPFDGQTATLGQLLQITNLAERIRMIMHRKCSVESPNNAIDSDGMFAGATKTR